MVLRSTMFSLNQEQKQEKQEQKQESSGWKWEVNHDGVIWSWSNPPVAIPTTPILTQSTPVKSQSQTQKKSLVDYWYTVHDGVAIPWSGEH
jgi:hypothetical protein